MKYEPKWKDSMSAEMLTLVNAFNAQIEAEIKVCDHWITNCKRIYLNTKLPSMSAKGTAITHGALIEIKQMLTYWEQRKSSLLNLIKK